MWPTKNKKNTISVTSTILVFFFTSKRVPLYCKGNVQQSDKLA